MDRVIYEKCKCGVTMQSEGVSVGIGYVYPPFHCDSCGYTEKCDLYGELDNCKKCTEYERCYKV